MKAATNKVYGPPSVIEIVDVMKPQPGPKEILVRVQYSSVSRTDDGFLRAEPFVTRFFTGLLRPKITSLGCEFSGIVEEVGSEVSEFKPGDKVFGFDDQKFGGHAEYKTIAAHKAVAKVPKNITLEQAAVALEGAHYALFYIYIFPKPSKDVIIFVNGATGGIGSAALQILNAMGYKVEASSTTKEMANIKKLGASKVIDWQTDQIDQKASKCDVYFDAVGKSSYKDARKILKPGGIYVSSELGRRGQNPLLAMINPLQRLFTGTNIKFPLPKTRKKEVELIAKYLAADQFRPLIDRTYAMHDIPKAYEYVKSGQKVGNVVVKIS